MGFCQGCSGPIFFFYGGASDCCPHWGANNSHTAYRDSVPGLRPPLLEARSCQNCPAPPGSGSNRERVKGIEPSYAAWEAAVLPLNYTRRSRLTAPNSATKPRRPSYRFPSCRTRGSSWCQRDCLSQSKKRRSSPAAGLSPRNLCRSLRHR